jgi:hypothetical protein
MGEEEESSMARLWRRERERDRARRFQWGF